MDRLILLTGVFSSGALMLHLAGSALVAHRLRRGDNRGRAATPGEGVTIVQPVCGIDNFAERTLSSTFRLTYPRYEILFCVAHADDPIVPTVRRLMGAHPHVRAKLLIGDDRISANPKLNNVAKGWNEAAHDWIVMADSNVLMPPDYLQQLLATWRADTGLVCSPPVGCSPAGIWAELECAFLNGYQARWQCFADSMGFGFAQGKTMLWRKDMLEAAGGIRALAAELAEDAASTKIVRRQRLRVRLVPRPFCQPLGERSLGEVWRRQLRWSRLRRDTFRLMFMPEILSGGFPPLLAVYACALLSDIPALAAVGVFAAIWYGAEAMLVRAAAWHLSWQSPLAWLIRDLMLPILWCASWSGKGFVWRGNAMRIATRDATVADEAVTWDSDGPKLGAADA